MTEILRGRTQGVTHYVFIAHNGFLLFDRVLSNLRDSNKHHRKEDKMSLEDRVQSVTNCC